MIEKLIDKYFLNKFTQHITNYLLRWFIDTKFIESYNKHSIELYIKKAQYKDEYYKCIYVFNKKCGLEYILEEERYLKIIKESVDNYLEENKGE